MGFVDGANLYDEYFAQQGVDPTGRDVRAPQEVGGLRYMEVHSTYWVFGLWGGSHLGNVVYDPDLVSDDEAKQVATGLFNKGETFDVLIISQPSDKHEGSFFETGFYKFAQLLGIEDGGFSPEMQARIDRKMQMERDLAEEFNMQGTNGLRRAWSSSPDMEFYDDVKKIPFLGAFTRITYGELIAEGETAGGFRALTRDVAESVAGAKLPALFGGMMATRIAKNGDEFVTLWKAPAARRTGAADEVIEGFDPKRYPGEGPFFATERSVAEKYMRQYDNGLQEIHILKSDYDKMVRDGIIQTDTLERASVHIPEEGLGVFNEALKRGPENVYHTGR